MIGISENITKQFSPADLARLFGSHAHKGEIRVIYERPNGNRTSPLPSSRHMQYVAKGWTAVEIYEEPPPIVTTRRADVQIPADVAEHARNDRVGIWTRGDARIHSSCRNAPDLLLKNWVFVGLADGTAPVAVKSVDKNAGAKK